MAIIEAKKEKSTHYYVYVYLDPTKPGYYHYPGLPFWPGYFEYEPFYIGKGIKNRDQHHLRVAEGSQQCVRWENKYKIRKIQKILRQGLLPLILHPFVMHTSEDAEKLEELCIKTIGRTIDGGPLVNKAIGDPFKGRMQLYGKDHPLYGKSRSDETKRRISEHHKPRDGKNNTTAKKWKIVDPAGNEYLLEGNLEQFCINHKIALGILKNYRNKGPYKMKRFTHTRGLASNTIGWSSEEIV